MEFESREEGLNDADISPIMKGTEADKAADYANYFCSYAYLYHQKQMLMDHNRMRAYYSAIMQNKSMFEGKIVLDVGTGSGVLAMWAAQAGAAKVYAVEFTDMAIHARNLVESNGLSDIIEVIQSSVEDLVLPHKVDIIVSEWMGYILLRESMLDSVIRARNKWLKPDGTLFPSHATMYWSMISFEEDRESKVTEYCNSMNDWKNFSNEMKSFYNIEMGSLENQYHKEQADYYIYSALWTELKPEHVIGQPVIIKRLDLNTCTLKDCEGVDRQDFSVIVPFPVQVSGFAGWFTVDFAGSSSSPVSKRVTLTTGPEGGYTHWGQQVFYLKDELNCSSNNVISGSLEMVRQQKNKRLYELNLSYRLNEDPSIHSKYEIP